MAHLLSSVSPRVITNRLTAKRRELTTLKLLVYENL
jgi:hypothetical protein